MLGVLLLTLRELRAKWIVVGLFVIATVIWGTMALALQLDVVDGSLAGARIFGDEAIGEEIQREMTTSGPPVADSLASPAADSSAAPLAADSAAAPTRAPYADAPEAQPASGGDGATMFGATSLLESIAFTGQVFVAGAAYWVGILLALFATGGLVASLLSRGEVDLLLSKPLSRSQILMGRLGGVWLVALALLTYLITSVWLVMSIKTGVWHPRFLLAIPVIWGMFAVLYSVVTLVSVTTGSAALSLMTVLAVLFATLVLSVEALDTQVAAAWRPLIVGLRHALPRFPAVGVQLVPKLAGAEPVAGLGAFGASLGIGALLYALAFWRFARRDF
ncbi:ABC transporter permease [Rubricoccus marinus]|uniref:ABC transporter permease n=1 Tax=Rubricoccus marinus TaxID=716817 RepID=A0A259U120_9BACT|nr:ABC transporter permease [Rubricoccus marinus]OZC03636.1 hypothetical protein BSZ36_11970 [Rubricoccus marinus]